MVRHKVDNRYRQEQEDNMHVFEQEGWEDALQELGQGGNHGQFGSIFWCSVEDGQVKTDGQEHDQNIEEGHTRLVPNLTKVLRIINHSRHHRGGDEDQIGRDLKDR